MSANFPSLRSINNDKQNTENDFVFIEEAIKAYKEDYGDEEDDHFDKNYMDELEQHSCGIFRCNIENAQKSWANVISENSSIREWLDGVKPGYGDRFGTAFGDVGVKDTDDLCDIGPDKHQLLQDKLHVHGARPLHLKKINAAMKQWTNVVKDI